MGMVWATYIIIAVMKSSMYAIIKSTKFISYYGRIPIVHCEELNMIKLFR